jgi:hypothetical protein
MKHGMINKWVLVIVLVMGCKTKMTEKGYADYINDPENKITQKIKIGEVQASMKWIPQEYYRLINKKNGRFVDSVSQDGLYYFDAKFEKTTEEKPTKEKLLYLDFDMQNDFVLLLGKDSIAPGICQKIENGIPGSYQYMLAFESRGKEISNDDFTVIYNDKIFGIGTIAFVYNQDDIKKIPKLKSKDSE